MNGLMKVVLYDLMKVDEGGRCQRNNTARRWWNKKMNRKWDSLGARVLTIYLIAERFINNNHHCVKKSRHTHTCIRIRSIAGIYITEGPKAQNIFKIFEINYWILLNVHFHLLFVYVICFNANISYYHLKLFFSLFSLFKFFLQYFFSFNVLHRNFL